MCSCVGGAQLSQELQSKLALSSRQARSDQRSFEVASSATFAPIFAALASASATMCVALAFPHSSQRFARRARALQLEARFCEVAPADHKTAKISFLAGQDVAPPSPRLRSPYPRQCALAASGLSLSLFSHVARSPRGAGNRLEPHRRFIIAWCCCGSSLRLWWFAIACGAMTSHGVAHGSRKLGGAAHAKRGIVVDVRR